jgi:hypothetical protein
MDATTTTVTHLATGKAWLVPAATYRPSHSARVRAMLAGADRCEAACCADRTTVCAGCGRFVAIDAPMASVTINGERIAVGAAQADRIANDHPAFVVGAPIAYAPATTVATCAACNGAPSQRREVLAALETAALDRLRRFATPLV